MGTKKTRVVQLAGGQRRERARNLATENLSLERPAPRRPSFLELFSAHYEKIRWTCARFAQPGVAIIAVDSERNRLSGSLCVAAKPGQANAAIIGRHAQADLFLEDDSSLSLRHLALLVHPLHANSDLRFRVLDLHTHAAFEDENGRRFEALTAESPIFIRCGRYAFFCLVTGDPSDWPDNARAAWECIPERVYLAESDAEPDRWVRHDGASPHSSTPTASRGASTVVQWLPGPAAAHGRLILDGEAPIGVLRISTDFGQQSLIVGPYAARRGILLGRYDRCDADRAAMLESAGLSRVHVLLVRIEDRLYAIDTASTNGVWTSDEQQRVRIQPLEADTKLMLGHELAVLRWIAGEPATPFDVKESFASRPQGSGADIAFAVPPDPAPHSHVHGSPEPMRPQSVAHVRGGPHETPEPSRSVPARARVSSRAHDSGLVKPADGHDSTDAEQRPNRCPSCGARNSLDAIFCTHCGKELANVSEPAGHADYRGGTTETSDGAPATTRKSALGKGATAVLLCALGAGATDILTGMTRGPHAFALAVAVMIGALFGALFWIWLFAKIAKWLGVQSETSVWIGWLVTVAFAFIANRGADRSTIVLLFAVFGLVWAMSPAVKALKAAYVLITAAIVFLLPVLVSGGVAIFALPKYKEAQIKTAEAGARTIREAVESWQAANNDTSCPTVAQLVQDKELDSAANTKDPWNEPYTIRCTGDDVIVTSNGPDTVKGTNDDIVEKAPAAPVDNPGAPAQAPAGYVWTPPVSPVAPPTAASSTATEPAFPESVAGFPFGVTVARASELCGGRLTLDGPKSADCQFLPVDLPFAARGARAALGFEASELTAVAVRVRWQAAWQTLTEKYGQPDHLETSLARWDLVGGTVFLAAGRNPVVTYESALTRQAVKTLKSGGDLASRPRLRRRAWSPARPSQPQASQPRQVATAAPPDDALDPSVGRALKARYLQATPVREPKTPTTTTADEHGLDPSVRDAVKPRYLKADEQPKASTPAADSPDSPAVPVPH